MVRLGDPERAKQALGPIHGTLPSISRLPHTDGAQVAGTCGIGTSHRPEKLSFDSLFLYNANKLP